MPAITDWSQVSDAGLEMAKTFLTPAQLSNVMAIAAAPRYTGPDTRAIQDGLLQGQQPGGPLWSLVHEAIGTYGAPKSGGISFAQAIRQYPQLTGLFVGYELFGITSGIPGLSDLYSGPDQLLALARETNTQQQSTSFQTSIALPDEVSPAEAAPYLGWVDHYLRGIFAETPTAIAGERDALVYMVISYARQNALAKGSSTPGVLGGEQGIPIVVANDLIHYRVTLPDGIEYLVMDDVTRDPNNRYVYRWVGPKFTPAVYTGGSVERNGVTTCIGAVPGTGSWYEQLAFGLIARHSSCDTAPLDFNDDYSLITSDIANAMTYQSGAPVKVTPSAGAPPTPQPGGPVVQSSPPSYQGGSTPPATPGAPITYAIPPGGPPVLLQPPPAPVPPPVPAPVPPPGAIGSAGGSGGATADSSAGIVAAVIGGIVAALLGAIFVAARKGGK